LGDLTSKQRTIWRPKSEVYAKAAFGRKFKIARQTVNKNLDVTNQKFFTLTGPVLIGIFVVTKLIFRKKE
jgi:hypothetical protein